MMMMATPEGGSGAAAMAAAVAAAAAMAARRRAAPAGVSTAAAGGEVEVAAAAGGRVRTTCVTNASRWVGGWEDGGMGGSTTRRAVVPAITKGVQAGRKAARPAHPLPPGRGDCSARSLLYAQGTQPLGPPPLHPCRWGTGPVPAPTAASVPEPLALEAVPSRRNCEWFWRWAVVGGGLEPTAASWRRPGGESVGGGKS